MLAGIWLTPHASSPVTGFVTLESKPECRQDEGQLTEYPMP